MTDPCSNFVQVDANNESLEVKSRLQDESSGNTPLSTPTKSEVKEDSTQTQEAGSVEDNTTQTDDKHTGTECSKHTKVPSVLYRLDYRDYTGNLLFRKENNKPIDAESAARLHWNTDGVPQKPVIEILTEITAQVKAQKKKQSGEPKAESAQDDDDPEDRYRDKDYGTINVSNVGKVEMIIHSDFLMNAIRDVVKYYPGQNLLVSDQQIVDAKVPP